MSNYYILHVYFKILSAAKYKNVWHGKSKMIFKYVHEVPIDQW